MSSKPVYGAEGRLGLIVPANNSVIEPEFWSRLPAGIAAYAARLLVTGDLTPETVHAMERQVDAAVDQLAGTGVDVIAYCDMVTSFIMEPGWNETATRRIASRTGTPCISAWTALRDALQALGVRTIALGTPYPAGIHAKAAPFFASEGVTVARDATLDVLAVRDVPSITAERLRTFVDTIDTTGCDALVLLATDLPTFKSIEALENQLGIPVLTSNQTLLWAAVRAVGYDEPITGLGRLLREKEVMR